VYPVTGQNEGLRHNHLCTLYTGASSEGGGGADKAPKPPVGRYVHMLNCTLAATQRTLCCILENHQTKEGVKVGGWPACILQSGAPHFKIPPHMSHQCCLPG
jgi:seryl-tRNA synthetase